jgi:hypothetical protein
VRACGTVHALIVTQGGHTFASAPRDMQAATAVCGGNLGCMRVRCQPACCNTTAAISSSPSQLLLSGPRPIRRPFSTALQPARMLPRRRAHLACRAAPDGWWRTGEQHWTFVESEQQLQQVVDDAPNVVLVGQRAFCVTRPDAAVPAYEPSANGIA